VIKRQLAIPNSAAVDRLLRYEVSLERAFDRALTQLERSQRIRRAGLARDQGGCDIVTPKSQGTRTMRWIYDYNIGDNSMVYTLINPARAIHTALSVGGLARRPRSSGIERS
jgi:hypothetical protein